MTKREKTKTRTTKETDITVKLNIDGTGESTINTGIGFLDHMLELFAFHGYFDLEIKTNKGDFVVDKHHTNEDIGIVLGQVFKDALGDKKGIKRNASVIWPMEDVVATVVVDISGRSFFKFSSPHALPSMGDQQDYNLEEAKHFLESFTKQLDMELTIQLDSANPKLHTNLEPVFKALGKALDEATQIDPRRKGIPSTKGVID